MTTKHIVAVVLGGATGSLLRLLIGNILPFYITQFAWATFFINMTGCLAIGFLYPLIINEYLKTLIIVGILGGFTTFSGFGLEIFRYIDAHQPKQAILYAGTSLILGTILVWIGYKTSLHFL